MEGNQVNFEQPLKLIKNELDQLDLSIVGLKDNMNTLKPFVDQFEEAKEKKRNLNHEKKEKQRVFNVMIDFYKKATGKMPDGMYPLFSQSEE